MCRHAKRGHCGRVLLAGAPSACQLAAVEDGLALVEVPTWALAAHCGQVAAARAVLLSHIDLVAGGKQGEFVSRHAKDCFNSLVAKPQCDDLSTRVEWKK